MIKTTSKKKTILTIICCMALCFQAVLSVLCFGTLTKASAASSQLISSGDFNDSPTVKSLQSPNSWTKITTYDDLTYAGVINVLKDDNNNYFNDYCESYGLTAADYPDKYSSAADNKILMINGEDTSSRCGYKSSAITLSANSHYVFSVYAKSLSGANSSIYLTGLADSLDSTNSFILVNSNVWKKYSFFIRTGLESKTCNLELWLGTHGGAGSQGAVFFDSAYGNQVSSREYYTTKASAESKKEIDLSTPTTYITNGNFDSGVHSLEKISGSTGELVSVAGNQTCDDLTANNVGAFRITNTTANATSYKTQNISIARHGLYIISLRAKLLDIQDGGKFGISINETDDIAENFLEYTPHTASLSLTTVPTSLDTLQNGFSVISFYVKGNTLFDTNVFVQFDLGTSDALMTGSAVIDNISITPITYTQYENATTSTTLTKLELSSQSSTPLVLNGHFNEVKPTKAETTPTYPIVPANWTHKTEEELADNSYVFGVMAETNNNYLYVENKIPTWQSFSSETFTLSEDKTYEITFQVKTNLSSGKLSATLSDSTNGVVTQFQEIVSNDNYTTYKVIVKTSKGSVTATISFHLGTDVQKALGSVCIDNVRAITKTTITDAMIKDMIESPNLTDRVVDYTDLWSLISENLNDNGVYDIASFSVTKSANNNFAGAIKSGNNAYDVISSKDGTNNNLLIIDNMQSGTTTLTAKSSFSMTTGVYYLISIDLKTINISTTENETYGATIQLNGIEKKFENAISSDDFKTFKFYVYVSEEVSPTLTLSLVSTSNANSHGVAVFDNFVVEEITQVKFDEDTAETMSNTLKIGETPEITEDEGTEGEEETGEEGTGEDELNNNDMWLLIPTILFGLSLIFAIVGFSLRKIKIKKWEAKKKSTYDRTKTLEKDIARREAEEKKKLELARLQEELDKIEEEINEYEKQYQSELQAYRTAKAQYKADKRTEKAERIERKFKEYAAKRAKLEDKTQDIKDKMDSFNNPEYLVIEERKIQIKNEKAKRKQQKDAEKQAKKQSKLEKKKNKKQ